MTNRFNPSQPKINKTWPLKRKLRADALDSIYILFVIDDLNLSATANGNEISDFKSGLLCNNTPPHPLLNASTE